MTMAVRQKDGWGEEKEEKDREDKMTFIRLGRKSHFILGRTIFHFSQTKQRRTGK